MRFVATLVMTAVLGGFVQAQQDPPPAPPAPPAEPAPAAPPPPPPPPPPPSPDVPNLRFEILIRDEGGGAPTTAKTVSVLARANNQIASVRSTGQLNASHPLAVAAKMGGIGVPLKVDVRGTYVNGRIPARVVVEYQPYWPEAKALPSAVTASVDAVFDNGRRMLISEAADPISDRRTTIEVTVAVLK